VPRRMPPPSHRKEPHASTSGCDNLDTSLHAGPRDAAGRAGRRRERQRCGGAVAGARWRQRGARPPADRPLPVRRLPHDSGRAAGARYCRTAAGPVRPPQLYCRQNPEHRGIAGEMDGLAAQPGLQYRHAEHGRHARRCARHGGLPAVAAMSRRVHSCSSAAIRRALPAGSLLLAGCSGEQIQSVLHPGGGDAAVIAEIAWLLFIGATVIFVGVMVLLAMSLRDGRRKIRPAVWLLGAGVAFPVTVLSALLVYSISRSQHLLEPVSHDALVVSVTARMWWWEVRYRDPQSGRDITLANEIRVPAGKPVYLALSSGDVIHSFWVPALAGKVDMLPGRLTRLRINTDKPGVYRGQCAEYCGEQHARMAL